MKVFKQISQWKLQKIKLLSEGASLGFVPTMGALHEGHLSLLKRSQRENDFTVCSIFVNPTQFNNPKDLETYPKTWESDMALLEALNVDFLIHPSYEELYPDSYRFKISESSLSHILCGQHRPGHFDGVLTVVMKLLNLAGATRAYFGEKDYQQYLLVKQMSEAFFHPTEIISCATVREKDGLAMSSRNLKLSPEDRALAPWLSKILSESTSAEAANQKLEEKGFKVDYVEDHWGRRFAAASLGSVRLIDNVLL